MVPGIGVKCPQTARPSLVRGGERKRFRSRRSSTMTNMSSLAQRVSRSSRFGYSTWDAPDFEDTSSILVPSSTARSP